MITDPKVLFSYKGKAQAQMYRRSLLEMERRRRRQELEHGELMTRVQYLAEEVCFFPSLR